MFAENVYETDRRLSAQVVKSACKAIVCDLFLMIEGQAEDELPERVRPHPQISASNCLLAE